MSALATQKGIAICHNSFAWFFIYFFQSGSSMPIAAATVAQARAGAEVRETVLAKFSHSCWTVADPALRTTSYLSACAFDRSQIQGP